METNSIKYAARNCLRKQFFQKAYLSLTSKSNTMDIKTFVFFDSETTGLPHLENNRTRMTELCFTAVQSDHIKLGIYPRIQNKVSFCFNPRKFINPEASEITGLSNELLEYQSTFNENAVNAIKNFLSLLREPVCLVAHNGNRFDFPILRAEIHKTGNELSEDILCVDSLLAFRQLHQQEVQDINKTIQTQEAREAELPIEFQDGFDELLCSIAEDVERSSTSTSTKLTVAEIQKINETTPTKNIIRGVTHVMKSNKIKVIQKKQNGTGPLRQLDFGHPSFRLQEVYKRLTSKEVADAHKAECDVNMLIECAAVLGERFINWSNLNARKFCDIPMMQPGKTIGT